MFKSKTNSKVVRRTKEPLKKSLWVPKISRRNEQISHLIPIVLVVGRTGVVGLEAPLAERVPERPAARAQEHHRRGPGKIAARGRHPRVTAENGPHCASSRSPDSTTSGPRATSFCFLPDAPLLPSGASADPGARTCGSLSLSTSRHPKNNGPPRKTPGAERRRVQYLGVSRGAATGKMPQRLLCRSATRGPIERASESVREGGIVSQGAFARAELPPTVVGQCSVRRE